MPILELTLNLSLFPEQILLPLAVYAYQDDEDTRFIFAGFDDDELKKMIVGTSQEIDQCIHDNMTTCKRAMSADVP